MNRRVHQGLFPAMPILAGGLLAYALLLWPGGIYTDTIGLIQQGQTGIYDDWHSPSLAVVLAILGTIRTGSGMLLLLGAGLLECGIYLILRRMGLSAIAAACSSVLIIFSPPVLAANFWLSKDTPALGSLLIGSALILSPRRPEAVTGGGFLLFACLVRLDYGVLSALAVGYAACMARSGLPPLSRTVRFCKASIIFFVACIAVQTGIHTALRVKSQAPVQASLLHDLAAISVATGDHRAPAFMLDQGWSQEFVASHFDPYSHDPLKWPGDHPPFAYTTDASDHLDTVRVWAGAISSHPLVYLHHRTRLMGALLGVSVPPKIEMPDTGWVEENSGIYCMSLRHLRLDDCAFRKTAYNTSMFELHRNIQRMANILFSPIPYLALCVLGVAYATVTSSAGTGNRYIFLLSALPLIHLPVLFLVVPSAEYRYLTLLFVAGQCVAALFVCLCFGKLKSIRR